MIFAWVLNALGLGFGVILGVRALIDPRWAAKLVRLKEDEQGGGFAEFRATYGGLFAASHGVALLLTLGWLGQGEYMIGVAAIGAAAVLAAAWGGTAVGRVVSMWRDGTDTKFNRLSVGVEVAVAFCIAAPWLAWLLFPPA